MLDAVAELVAFGQFVAFPCPLSSRTATWLAATRKVAASDDEQGRLLIDNIRVTGIRAAGFAARKTTADFDFDFDHQRSVRRDHIRHRTGCKLVFPHITRPA